MKTQLISKHNQINKTTFNVNKYKNMARYEMTQHEK